MAIVPRLIRKLKLPFPKLEWNEIAIWASGTPEHFLIHVCGKININQQMDLDLKFNETTDVVKNLRLDLDIAKDAYFKAKREHKKKKEENPHRVVEAGKMALNNAQKAWDDAEAMTDVIGAQIFQLYANLLFGWSSPVLGKDCEGTDQHSTPGRPQGWGAPV